jgi:transcriptional antiterminator RfaH
MPILPREPDIFPQDLLNGYEAPPEWEASWWALHTLPRREKDLVRRLRRLGIPHYSPLIARRSRSPGGRIRTSYVPLFSGYVFVRGGEDQRYHALTTNCVSRCLEVPDESTLVHDLHQIQRLIACGAPLSPESRIEPGMRVRIRSGSLAGLEGVVIRRRGRDRLLVVVRFLQRGASVELEDFQVERIDG